MAYEQLKLDKQLCFRLYTASRLITQAYEPLLRPLGITYTQYLVLLILWERDEQTINEIGKSLYLGINTTSPLIKRMEKLGILSRRGSADDKRMQIIFLTDKGKALKTKAALIPKNLVNGLGSCNIATKNLPKMIPLLDELINNLSASKI